MRIALLERPSPHDGRRSAVALAAALIATAIAAASTPTAAETFPVARPANRIQAVATLAGGTGSHVTCLTPIVVSLRQDPRQASPAARRALAVLQGDVALPLESRWTEPDGTLVRYTFDRGSFDRIDPADDDADGLPDAVEAARDGLAEARRLLVERTELADPGPVEILLGRLGAGQDGVLVPGAGRGGRALILLDGSGRFGTAALRRAAIHQYAHAVALAFGPTVSMGWGESLATWTALRLGAGDDERTRSALAGRLERLHAGLGADDLDLAAGNAVWLAFLDEAYGPNALRLAFEEMAKGGSIALAFDRALRRGAGLRFSEAFRDFQLWALLVGDRDDGRHFSFASRAPSPTFAATVEGLPAIAVQDDPAVAGLGATATLLRPGEADGGVTVRFDGDGPGRWDADLLLYMRDGSKHRVVLPLDPDGRGEATLPLDAVGEIVLLVRNLDGEDRMPRRYSWSAHREPGYPFELASLSATALVPGGVLVAWETRSEHAVLGFNVFRVAEDGDAAVRVNPVWVPAVGDRVIAASYQFLDVSAVPGVRYSYRLEGITPQGLSTRSAFVRTEVLP